MYTEHGAWMANNSALNVLMLEDSEEDAGLVLHQLRNGGFDVDHMRVQSADDFKDALNYRSWDIILSDYAMPGFNGMEAYSILKSSGLDLPFIMVSGTIGEDVAVKAMRHGIQDYLMKDQLARLAVAVSRELKEAEIRREKKHLYSILKSNERRYQSIFNSAAVSLWEVDFFRVQQWLDIQNINNLGALQKLLKANVGSSDLRFNQAAQLATILDVNQTTLSMLGLEDNISVLGSIEDCWPNGFQTAWNAILEAIVSGHESLQTEGSLLAADGTRRYFLISLIIPQNGEEFKNVVISCYDTTQQHHMERQIIASHRMEAVGQLAGGIAHDFNNLLTVILNASDLLQDEIGQPSNPKYELVQIQRAAERAAQLTQQLLAFSRKQVLQVELIDINDSVKEIINMLGKLIGEHISLSINLSKETIHINADPTQLEQIILNLLINARDAMPEGGELTVSTSNVSVENLIEYSGHKKVVIPDGEYALLTVEDTGTGIAPDILEHIFEPFFTTKEQGKGTGLGLATAYGNIQQNNGYMIVNTELGKGTSFKMYFPSIQMQEASNEAKGDLPLITGGTETILIAEDEWMVRDIASQILKRQGYHLIQADNGESALALASSYQGKIHLLLTDMVMPQMGGKKLVEKFSVLYPETKVLFMSGYSPEELNGVRFTQKPFLKDELVLAVREALDSE